MLPDLINMYDHFKTHQKNNNNPEIPINNNSRSEPYLDKFTSIKTYQKKQRWMTVSKMNMFVLIKIFVNRFLEVYFNDAYRLSIVNKYLSMFNYILISGNTPEE